MARAIADVEARTIKQLAQSKWRSSGLTDQHARRSGMRALSASQIKALNSRFHEAGALLLPYFDLTGKQTKFYRVRYLEKLPGAAGLGNPQRYDQPTAVGAVKGRTTADARMLEAYYPPLVDWVKIAKNVEISICITEGELKAACACANKIPMMALGGVYSFMSGGRAIDFLLSMKQIEWEGRKVYIVYDNDLAENPDVLRAQNMLADRLLSRGAKVSYITIPPGPAKGVDDFIVASGAKAFVDLIDNAGPFLESQALWQLNSEVVFIRNIDAVVERETSLLMYPDQFVRHIYANRHYMGQVERGSGKNKHVVMEKQPLAPRWMEWEQRAELRELVYAPQPVGVVNKVINGKAFNTWEGWGRTPKRGDVGPWVWLLDFLFQRDHKTRKYFEQWCAYPIQNPGAKMFVAAVLWSRVKRLGKSLVGLSLTEIYGKNGIVVGPKQLTNEFNFWAKNRQLVVGEEITSGDRRVDTDYMKYIITSPTVTINEKNKPQYVHDNLANFLLFSNWSDCVRLESGDKRYLIHGISHTAPAPPAKYKWCDAWLWGDGPSYLMDHLLRLPMRGFDPKAHAPETMSKYEMITASMQDMDLWVMRLMEDPVTVLRPLGQAAAEGCDLYTSDQIYRAFDPQGRNMGRGTVANMGRALGHAGLRQVNGGTVPVRTNTGLHRLYAIRNSVRWDQATRKEIKEHYEQFFGPKMAGGVK